MYLNSVANGCKIPQSHGCKKLSDVKELFEVALWQASCGGGDLQQSRCVTFLFTAAVSVVDLAHFVVSVDLLVISRFGSRSHVVNHDHSLIFTKLL